MNDKQIGYVAGVVDGEANVSIRRIGSSKIKRSSFYCYMNVSNTSLAMLQALKEMTGAGYINGPFKNVGDNRRPYWKWHVPQAEVLVLLALVRDLLIVKRAVVSLVFAMRELQSSDWRSTASDVLAARESIFEQAKECNRRGAVAKRVNCWEAQIGLSAAKIAGDSEKVQRLGAESRTDSNAPTSALPERDDIVRASR